MVNTQRLEILADLLENNQCPVASSGAKVGFNMRAITPDSSLNDKTGNHCGTSACIAGWTLLLWGTDADRRNGWAGDAGRILDLDEVQQQHLFFAQGSWLRWENITPQQAANAICSLVDTGEVKW